MRMMTIMEATVEKKGVAPTTPRLRIAPIRKVMILSKLSPLPKGRMPAMRMRTRATTNMAAERAAISRGAMSSWIPHQLFRNFMLFFLSFQKIDARVTIFLFWNKGCKFAGSKHHSYAGIISTAPDQVDPIEEPYRRFPYVRIQQRGWLCQRLAPRSSRLQGRRGCRTYHYRSRCRITRRPDHAPGPGHLEGRAHRIPATHNTVHQTPRCRARHTAGPCRPQGQPPPPLGRRHGIGSRGRRLAR